MTIRARLYKQRKFEQGGPIRMGIPFSYTTKFDALGRDYKDDITFACVMPAGPPKIGYFVDFDDMLELGAQQVCARYRITGVSLKAEDQSFLVHAQFIRWTERNARLSKAELHGRSHPYSKMQDAINKARPIITVSTLVYALGKRMFAKKPAGKRGMRQAFGGTVLTSISAV